ncbi:MAG: hypothetical protein V1734_01665 [Nanoarchaeota archaeon]
MGEIIIEPERIVRAYIDIKPYADAVLEIMNETSLKGKSITRFFLPFEEYARAFCKLSKLVGVVDNPTAEQVANSLAFNFESPLRQDNFLLFMKHMPLAHALPAYFHELGHIATASFTRRKDVKSKPKLILAEMLADSFESWACDEFNNLSGGFKFKDQLYLLCYRVESQKDVETAAYRSSGVMESDRCLLKFYEKKKPKAFGNLFRILNSEVQAQQNITSLDFLIA